MNWNLMQYVIMGAELLGCLVIVYLLVMKMTGKSSPDSPLAHFFVYLRRATEDQKQQPSLMRFNNLYALLMWAPGILFGYIWIVTHPAFKDLVIPFTDSLLGAVCIMLGIKLGQKVQERKTDVQQGQGPTQ